MKHLQTEGRISPEIAEAVKTEDFLKFLQCESGKRMHQAAKKKQLYKEQPFVLGVADELVRRYQSQLTYYARALSQITGKAVKEKIIYSFALGKEINV